MRPTRLMLALALATLPALAGAEALPDPRQLIDRHLEASGGAEAIRDSGDGSAKMSIVVAENGMRGEMQVHSRGRDMVMTMSMAGMEIHTGMVGDIAWSIDPMLGPRLLEGEELDEQRRSVDPDVITFSDAAIESMKTVALADSEGRPCHRVEIRWKGGDETATCFGLDDGLALYSESTSVSPMGEMRQVIHLYDYKTIGKVRVPSRMRSVAMGMTQVMTIDDYQEGTPPDEVFALPPAIEALLDAGTGARSAE